VSLLLFALSAFTHEVEAAVTVTVNTSWVLHEVASPYVCVTIDTGEGASR